VLSIHAAEDPEMKSEAEAAYASSIGAGMVLRRNRGSRYGESGSLGNAEEGVGGFIHVIDQRSKAEAMYLGGMRRPEPDDILGSLTVDGMGRILEGGFVGNEMYRVVTGEGLITLTPFLEGKLVERLREEEEEIEGKGTRDIAPGF